MLSIVLHAETSCITFWCMKYKCSAWSCTTANFINTICRCCLLTQSYYMICRECIFFCLPLFLRVTLCQPPSFPLHLVMKSSCHPPPPIFPLSLEVCSSSISSACWSGVSCEVSTSVCCCCFVFFSSHNICELVTKYPLSSIQFLFQCTDVQYIPYTCEHITHFYHSLTSFLYPFPSSLCGSFY